MISLPRRFKLSNSTVLPFPWTVFQLSVQRLPLGKWLYIYQGCVCIAVLNLSTKFFRQFIFLNTFWCIYIIISTTYFNKGWKVSWEFLGTSRKARNPSGKGNQSLDSKTYNISRWSMIIWVIFVLVIVDSDWCFDNLCSGHLQSQNELYHELIVITGRLSVKPQCYPSSAHSWTVVYF